MNRLSHPPRLLLVIALLLVILPSLLLRLNHYPRFWFDEGYKAAGARTLLEKGVYGTYTVEGLRPFDPGMSSGPADIAPTALSFWLFGPGIVQARIVSVLYALLALYSIYKLTAYIADRSPALLAILLIVAIPLNADTSFIRTARQLLSEVPAMALILLGLHLWFLSWKDRRVGMAIIAGICMGLGILTKTQVAVALLPSLFVIFVWRWWHDRKTFAVTIAPLVMTVAIYALWSLTGYLLTSPDVRQKNSQELMEAIYSVLITGLWGSTLSSGNIFLALFMAIGVGLRLPGIIRAIRQQELTDPIWAEMALIIFVFCGGMWFAFLSVGWSRYAFPSILVTWILLSKSLAQGLLFVERHYGHLWRFGPKPLTTIVIVGLLLLAILTNLRPLVVATQDSGVQRIGQYIRTQVPPNAIIESWEWEVDILSGHWEFHHPHQRYLFIAIRQFSHQGTNFSLGYDTLAADPDYLLIGPFATWTHIYDPAVVKSNFQLITTSGDYNLYQRIR